MKNILKWEYNKGKHISQIIFHIFCILWILILLLFFLTNFPEKKLGKVKRNKKYILVLYHELHNFYQSLHFINETLSNWRFNSENLLKQPLKVFRKKVFLEIAAAILKNFFKIAVKLPCESVVKILEKYLWRS